MVLRVSDRSMEPAIAHGSFLVVSRWRRTPKAGDVVVSRHPHKELLIVKRVGAIDRDGGLFLVGDNRIESEDSRAFGCVGRDNVVGKVLLAV